MSHDTHHTHEAHHENAVQEKKSKTALRSSFWFVLILAGLFIAALNFVKVMGSDDGGGHGASHATEAHATEAHESGMHDATTHPYDAAPHADEPAGNAHPADAAHEEAAH